MPVGAGADTARSVIQQADGKLVLSGWSSNGANLDFSLIRLNTNGTLDTSFDGDGKLLVPVGTGNDQSLSVIQQADGKLVVAGTSPNGLNSDFSLIRLNTNGTLDTSFDGDGKLTVGVTGSDAGTSVIQQADGKLVVAGLSFNGTNNDFSLIRLNTNGSLDTSFDGDGKLLVPVGTGSDSGQSVIQQADGKLVVAGWSSNGSNNDFSLIRLNTDGSLDTSFDTDGKLLVPVGAGTDQGWSVIQQADGKLVVAGTSSNGSNDDFSLIRLNTDGSLDTSFDTDGKLLVPVGTGGDTGWSVSQQADGKLVVAGTSSNDFSLIRLNTDGSLDTTFNPSTNTLGGTVVYTENAAAVALDTTVQIADAQLASLNSGAGNYSGASLSLARQGGANAQDVLALNTTGASFTVSGANLQSGGQTFATFTSTGGTLAINFTGSGTLPTQALVNDVLSRITYANSSDAPTTPSITLAWSFSDGNSGTQGTGGALAGTGTSMVNITAVNDAPTIQGIPSTTQAVVVGTSAALSNFAVADADGTGVTLTVTLTPTNGTLGNVTDADPVAAGIQLTGTAAAINLALYGATFNATAAGAASVGVSVSDGIAGAVTGTYNLVASAAGPNTAPTFLSGTGKAIMPDGSGDFDQARSVIQQADGKLVVAGWGENSGEDFRLIRLNADGSLDTTFGTGGTVLQQVDPPVSPIPADRGYSVIQQADGKLVVAGYSGLSTTQDFSLIRLNANGSLDTSFSGDGKLRVPVGSGNDQGFSVIQQTDGKLVVAGFSRSPTDDFSLIRLNADGTLDTTFDTDGKLLVPVGAANEQGNSVTQQTDGKLVVAGIVSPGFGVIRLNDNGSLDTSFDTDGKFTLSVLGSSIAGGFSVIQQADGKLVVAGANGNVSTPDFVLIRLNADGTLDGSFDGDGQLTVGVGGGDDASRSVIQQADGKLVVAGFSSNGSNNDFSLIRLNADGSRDTSFDGDGRLLVPVGTATDEAYSVIQQTDGKLVVAGTSSNDFSLIRLNPNGTLDTTFNPSTNTLGGTVAYTENAAAVALDTTVQIADAQLASLNSGAGNYSGASLSLARQGGADSQDVLGFNTTGASFTLSGANLQSGGQTFATFTSTGGTLTINFTSSGTIATQALVNDVLSRITYANSSDAPTTPSITLAWSFSDGNTGSQGTGGALAGTGTSTVNITAVNDAPTIAGVPGSAQAVVVGMAAALDDFTVTDPDGTGVSLTVTLTTTNGTLSGVTDGNVGLPGIQVSGTAATINAALSVATFSATSIGPATVGISVSDGVAAATTATYSLTATPAAPTATLAADSGASNSDSVTNNGQFNVGGLVGGATWEYSLNGGGGWTAGTGTSATLTGDGAKSVTVRQTSGGVTSASSTALTFTLDTTAAPPTPTLSADTGSSNSDGITNNGQFNVAGLEAAATWQYSLNSGTNWTNGTGTSVTLTGDGAKSLTVRQTDVAGNTSAPSTALAFTLDTAAAPPTPTLSADTGSSNSDGITNNGQFNVAGLEAGATWQYSLNSGTNWTNGTGTSVTLTGDGAKSLTVRQTDAAGSTSAASAALAFTLDTTAPSLNAAGSSPADDAATVTVSSNLTLKFSEALVASGSDLSKVRLKDVATDAVVAATVSINGSGDLVIDPTPTLPFATAFYVNWDTGALKDAAGNAAAPVANQTGYNFTTEAAPAPPADPDPGPQPVVSTVDGATVRTTVGTGPNGTVTIVNVSPVTNRPADGRADIPVAMDAQGNPLLQVGLPVGVGLQVQSGGGGSAGLDAIVNQLLGADADPDLLADIALGLAAAFGAGVPSGAVLRAISLSMQGSTPPTETIRIGGATSSPTAEILIIDARRLPPGTVIDLSLAPFAIVVGNASYTGGEGRNVVVADRASQFLVLGPGNDELRAGAGNDTVGSKSGNDKLYGGAGNDQLIGGIGNDSLWGGEGNDILQGGTSDAGTWVAKLDARGQLQLSFTPGNTDLADSPGLNLMGTYTTPSGKGLVTDERLAFVHQDYGRVQDVSLLFHALVGRLPTLAELGQFSGSGFSLGELARAAHNVYLQVKGPGGPTPDAQVRALVNHVLGSSAAADLPAGQALVQQLGQQLDAGVTWADLWLAASRSQSHQATLPTSADGLKTLTQVSKLGETGWSLNAGDNELRGEAGNDVLIGGSGSNLLDGGAGTDLAVFFGSWGDFEVAQRGTDLLLKHIQSGAINTLQSIEYIRVGLQTVKTADFKGLPANGSYTDLAPVVQQVVSTVGLASTAGVAWHPDWA